MLAVAKQNSVSEFNQISDSEFNIVVREVQKYHELKTSIRSDFRKKISQPHAPDLEKLDLKN